jgi:ribosome biogenesis protein ERB1
MRKPKTPIPQEASDSDDSPALSRVDSEEDESGEDEESVYDSEDGLVAADAASDDDEDDDFEDQGSSDEEDDRLEDQANADESEDEDVAIRYENEPRTWKKKASPAAKRGASGKAAPPTDEKPAKWMHTDDWSSDDDDPDGSGNRIGRVPLHWYDEYDHIGYGVDGSKVVKSASTSGDRLDQAIALQDNMAAGKFEVHDALNDRTVELSTRQLELIRRVQAGAFAHPEHEAHPDYIDYFSGVNQEVSGLTANRYEPKSRFQPSKWEKLHIDRLLRQLRRGEVTLDYLKGKSKQKEDPNKPFIMWTGDDEDELALRKGPQHIAAPKLPPPGHAESYVPPDEYLPNEEDLQKWADMDPKDRPHGLFVPKKFANLRSVGAYQHSVREAFERCLDLYLCPRVMKRRLNIDPESLVPRLPKASDLKPFPTAKCTEYKTPHEEGEAPPMVRCVTPSPDGQFMASGATDGYVRLWEVETGRLVRSWDISKLVASPEDETDEIKPVVDVKWNPNPTHHCLLAACGKAVVVIASGTAGKDDADLTEALLSSAVEGGNVTHTKAQKTVTWKAVSRSEKDVKGLSTGAGSAGPVCVIHTSREVASLRWHIKGDYFVSISPKAAAAAVMIHQLSKGNTQQPFSKSKGEAQTACFHPNKPFLFVANQQHVRVYHLVKQAMVKRLSSGCRWISSIDVHPSGDHLILGSLDRRMVWFDMDLGATPYKTLKYHERGLRSCQFHGRYPLMASASDDGAVHIFHSMVYSDLMRNPLIVPVKILRGHTVTKKLGVLTLAFHPTQPWVFTGGADGKIILFQDI